MVGSDISARDNVSLSMAATNITNVMTTLRDRGLCSDEEYLRMIYRFASEVVDVEEILASADPPYVAPNLVDVNDMSPEELERLKARLPNYQEPADRPRPEKKKKSRGGVNPGKSSDPPSISRPASSNPPPIRDFFTAKKFHRKGREGRKNGKGGKEEGGWPACKRDGVRWRVNFYHEQEFSTQSQGNKEKSRIKQRLLKESPPGFAPVPFSIVVLLPSMDSSRFNISFPAFFCFWGVIMTYTMVLIAIITLTHPDVNGGAPYGFRIDAQMIRFRGFQDHREVITGLDTRCGSTLMSSWRMAAQPGWHPPQ